VSLSHIARSDALICSTLFIHSRKSLPLTPVCACAQAVSSGGRIVDYSMGKARFISRMRANAARWGKQQEKQGKKAA
jgi:hypothetical protein